MGALVLGVVASTVNQEYFEWILWSICFVLCVLLWCDYTRNWWKWAQIAVIVVAAIIFCYVGGVSLLEYSRPSFAVLRPVSWVLPSARSTEIFVADEVGHKSLS